MVKINQRFQDLHSNGSQTDWVVVQQVERDICLLYHQLAEYSYIMGDLYYGDVFALPYWDFLNVTGVEPDVTQFIREGCLIMIFAMASEVIDGSGAYLTMDKDRYAACKSAVAAVKPSDPDTDKLVAAVEASFAAIDAGEDSWAESDIVAEVNTVSTWIHERYVRGYFENWAREFSSNAYYRGEGPPGE